MKIETSNKIKNEFTKFENAVENNDFTFANDIGDNLLSLIKERNNKCRILK